MRYVYKRNIILENISMARSVLRKNNIEEDNEDYQKILNYTGKDGYLGIITKLRFTEEDIDTESVLNLYDKLKEKKVNVAKISRKNYEEVLDYLDSLDQKENEGILYLFKHLDYKVFQMKDYKSALNIMSPSWCIKTKKYWNNYVLRGVNIIAIKNEYVDKKGNTTLDVPNTFKNDKYTNFHNPEVRIGITLNRLGNISVFFDDNNTNNRKYYNIVKSISSRVKSKYLNKITFKYKDEGGVEYTDNDWITDFIYNLVKYDNRGLLPGSFNTNVADKNITNEIQNRIEVILNTEVDGTTVSEFIVNNVREVIQSGLNEESGLMDIILYESFKRHGMDPNEHSIHLSGYLLNEAEIYEKLIRYSYGVSKTKYGRAYIKQSYDNIDDYLNIIADNFHLYFFYDGGDLQFYDSGILSLAFNEDYIHNVVSKKEQPISEEDVIEVDKENMVAYLHIEEYLNKGIIKVVEYDIETFDELIVKDNEGNETLKHLDLTYIRHEIIKKGNYRVVKCYID